MCVRLCARARAGGRSCVRACVYIYFRHDLLLDLVPDDDNKFVLYYLRGVYSVTVLCRQNHTAAILISIQLASWLWLLGAI